MMLREKAQAAQTARPKVPMRRSGADCFVVAMKRGNARGAKGVGHRHWIGPTGNGRSLIISGRRQPSRDGTSRMNREVHVRICERLGVKFPGPTRRVSRGSPVQTAMRNCTRDEGRSFEAGSQVLASNRCKLLSSKAMVVSVAVNVGKISRRVRLREASASELPMNCRKPIRRCQNRGVTLPPGSVRENPEACPSGIRHVGGCGSAMPVVDLYGT